MLLAAAVLIHTDIVFRVLLEHVSFLICGSQQRHTYQVVQLRMLALKELLEVNQ